MCLFVVTEIVASLCVISDNGFAVAINRQTKINFMLADWQESAH